MRVGRTNESLPVGALTPLAPAASEPLPEAEVAPAGRPEQGAASNAFGQLLRGLGQELDRGESIAGKAIRGGISHTSLSPERLIALQAGIYRYSEAVDLATKLVDRGTQAVRTTLQNQ